MISPKKKKRKWSSSERLRRVLRERQIPITFYLLKNKIDELHRKANAAGIFPKDWLLLAIMYFDVENINKKSPSISLKREKVDMDSLIPEDQPIDRTMKEWEEIWMRRRAGIFTEAEKKRWPNIENGQLDISHISNGATEDGELGSEWLRQFRNIFGMNWYDGFTYESNEYTPPQSENNPEPKSISKTKDKQLNREWRLQAEAEAKARQDYVAEAGARFRAEREALQGKGRKK